MISFMHAGSGHPRANCGRVVSLTEKRHVLKPGIYFLIRKAGATALNSDEAFVCFHAAPLRVLTAFWADMGAIVLRIYSKELRHLVSLANLWMLSGLFSCIDSLAFCLEPQAIHYFRASGHASALPA